MRRLLIPALIGTAICGGASLGAGAAPLSTAPLNAGSEVIQVHGFHRGCRWGRGYYHRHQRDGDRVLCGRRPGVTLYFGTRPHWHRGGAHRHRFYRDRDHRHEGHRERGRRGRH